MPIDPSTACPNCGREINLETGECRYCGPVAPAFTATPAPAYQPAPAPPLSPWVLSGKWSVGGLIVLLVLAVVSGLVCGYGYHYTAQFFDIPLVSPALGGLIAGGLVAFGVKKTKTRNKVVAMVAGVVAGLTMYGARNVFDSYALRPAMVASLSSDIASRENLPATNATALAEKYLTPINTIRWFNDAIATNGVEIKSTSDQDTTITGPGGTTTTTPAPGATVISGPWYYVMLGVEAIVAALAGAGLAAAAYNIPFCEGCNVWTKEQKPKVLKLNPGRVQTMVSLIEQQDWANLVRLQPTGPMNDKNYAATTLHKCEQCGYGVISVFAIGGKTSKTYIKANLDPQTVQIIEAHKAASIAPQAPRPM